VGALRPRTACRRTSRPRRATRWPWATSSSTRPPWASSHVHVHALPAHGGPRELDRVLPGRVSLGHSTSSPRRGRHGRGEAEAAPQLEPRSRHSVTLRAPAKPRNPAYPQPLRILVLVQDSGIRPTGDRVLISADRRALDRRRPTCCPQVGLLDAEFLRV